MGERHLKARGRNFYYDNLSSAPPNLYCERFRNFMSNSVFVCKNIEQKEHMVFLEKLK